MVETEQKDSGAKAWPKIKTDIYQLCKRGYEDIIVSKITDEAWIEELFDLLWNYIDDEPFHALFWELIRYVETFDPEISAFYRRIEEVHFEGY